MAKKKVKRKIGKAVQPKYTVLVNNGNSPGGTIVSLAEVVDIVKGRLIDAKEREVILSVKAVMVPGKFAVERADGVK